MKKFLVVLLSLGLIVGVSATASALDVSFSGSYQVEGAYESNVYQSGGNNGYFGGDTSRAAVWQRFRLQPVFKVAEGLSMTVRLDALEKQWGNTMWRGNGADDFTNSRRESQVVPTFGNTNGQKTQENIEFERSYVTFDTRAGQFQVGYQRQKTWGTAWHDWEQSGPRAMFSTKFGPVALLAIWDKSYEGDALVQGTGSASTWNKVDADIDQYSLAGVYYGKGLEVGLLYQYALGAAPRLTATPYKVKQHALLPYVKATFGPVYLESEFGYSFGKSKEYESGVNDVTVQAWGGYAKLRTNLGPAYFGAAGGYSSGDDLQDATKKKNVFNAKAWNPALILLGDDYLTDIFPGGNAYDAGHFSSYKNSAGGFMIANVFGGFNVSPKLNLEASFTSGQFAVNPRDAAGVEYVSKNMGMEFDVTATYKVYDNLTYMVGAGYLFTGDAFKGTDSNKTIGNDYMLMNRLALSF